MVTSFVQIQQWRLAEGEISVFPEDLAQKSLVSVTPCEGICPGDKLKC